MTGERELPDRLIQVTPRGALAGAYMDLLEEMKNRPYWARSPLLTAVRLDELLRARGYEIIRVIDEPKL